MTPSLAAAIAFGRWKVVGIVGPFSLASLPKPKKTPLKLTFAPGSNQGHDLPKKKEPQLRNI